MSLAAHQLVHIYIRCCSPSSSECYLHLDKNTVHRHYCSVMVARPVRDSYGANKPLPRTARSLIVCSMSDALSLSSTFTASLDERADALGETAVETVPTADPPAVDEGVTASAGDDVAAAPADAKGVHHEEKNAPTAAVEDERPPPAVDIDVANSGRFISVRSSIC